MYLSEQYVHYTIYIINDIMSWYIYVAVYNKQLLKLITISLYYICNVYITTWVKISLYCSKVI